MTTINTAIILAGGLGTRLRNAVPDLPKCLAPVAGKPFISFVIEALQKNGVVNFIFSLGYMHEHIEDFIQKKINGLQYCFSVEDEPLGTGGAIKLACKKTNEKNVLIANGDTLFDVDIASLSSFHFQKESDCTLSLKTMGNFDRYGVVELNNDNSISSFKEKRFYLKGLINGGLYALNRDSFMKETFPDKFSFEKDYLEALYKQRKMFGIIQDKYFIDIGIPEDFERAGRELR